jgi:SAM-dependent methyltransferase
MDSLQRFYPESRFGGFSDIDGTMVFFNRVNSLLDPSFVVLDVGCGRGGFDADPILVRRNLRILRGKVAKVIGIDVDRQAQSNPFVDEFRLIEGSSWPIEKGSIDLIVCDNVLEHIADPDALFGEVRRVLRIGGYLCLRTPNRWNYIAQAAMLIPRRYHSRVTSMVQAERKEEDVFPAFYRCNTIRKLRNTLRRYGFESVVYGYEAEPSYLAFSTIAYLLGVLHQRLAPGFMRPALFAFGRIHKDVI